MRYLSIYRSTNAIVCIDLNNPDRSCVTDGIYYTDFHNAYGYISNYKDIFNAKLDRRTDTGEIKLYDIARKLTGEALISYLESLLSRGKDKHKRQMHPNSIANLCTAARFSQDNRPSKKSKLSDEQLDEAMRLREAGFAWRILGDRFGISHDTLRLAVRNRRKYSDIRD